MSLIEQMEEMFLQNLKFHCEEVIGWIFCDPQPWKPNIVVIVIHTGCLEFLLIILVFWYH